MTINQVPIGKIANFINGFAFKPSDWSNDGYKIIRIQNLTNKSKPYNYTNKEVKDRYIVKKGDILVSWSATIDIFEWEDEDAYLNQHIFKVEFDDTLVEKSYFKLALKRTIEELSQLAHGATMKHVTKKKFDKHRIPLPETLDDQIKIANLLTQIETLIAKREESIALLDELLKSTFLDMFGDPRTNNKHWDIVKLGILGDWKSGGTPLRKESKYYEGNIPWYSSGELNDMFIFDSKEHITKEAIINSNTKEIEIGSLLLGMYDTAALKSSITTMIATCNQAIAFSKLDENKCNTFFLYYLIQIGKEYFRRMQRGVRQQNMNITMIKNIPIILPPKPLQDKFAIIVQQVEATKAHYQKSLDELNELFGSLSQRAFRGELDLGKMDIVEQLTEGDKEDRQNKGNLEKAFSSREIT